MYLHINPIHAVAKPGEAYVEAGINIFIQVSKDEPGYQHLLELMGQWNYYVSPYKWIPESKAEVKLTLYDPTRQEVSGYGQSFTISPVKYYIYGWYPGDTAFIDVSVRAKIPAACDWGGKVDVDVDLTGPIGFSGRGTESIWLRITDQPPTEEEIDPIAAHIILYDYKWEPEEGVFPYTPNDVRHAWRFIYTLKNEGGSASESDVTLYLTNAPAYIGEFIAYAHLPALEAGATRTRRDWVVPETKGFEYYELTIVTTSTGAKEIYYIGTTPAAPAPPTPPPAAPAPAPPPEIPTPTIPEAAPRCFIVSALGENELVEKARMWRDARGVWFRPVQKVYYVVSPPLAMLIRRHEKLRRIVKFILVPIIKAVVKGDED